MGFKVREGTLILQRYFQFRLIALVNGHIESHYSVKTGKWSEPIFVRDPFLRVHGMAPALNYGQQCYEGMKAFRTPDDRIAIFRPDQNAERMQRSATYVAIPPVPPEHFLNCVRLAVGLNAEYVPPHHMGSSMYIRPMLFGSSAQLGLDPPEEYMFCVYVMATGVYHGVHPIDGLMLEDFDRAAPKGTGAAKIGGNYAPVMPWSKKAYSEGYGITLHMDSRTGTEIDEFSTSGFIGVKKDGEGFVLAVPDSKNVIKSVTATSACEIAESFGWKVEKRRIVYQELSEFSEVMAAGTAAALVPLKSLHMKSRGDRFTYEAPGPAFSKLLDRYKAIQQGKIKDPFGWLDIVEDPKDWQARQDAPSNGMANGGRSAEIDRLD